MGSIKINEKTGFTYIPLDLRDIGFKGEVEILPSELVVVIVKPNAPIESVIKNLQMTLKNLQLKLETSKVS